MKPPLKPLNSRPIAMCRSPDCIAATAEFNGTIHQRSDTALSRDGVAHSGTLAALNVAQPWHGYENSAPNRRRDQIPFQRIARLHLVSSMPDRRLTGERTAEGWATRLTMVGFAAVASGDAKLSPRVRIQQFEPCRALPLRKAEERNLLSWDH